MANKKEMTPYEASLFAEMKKLSKRANQRIVRLERETGLKESFATKQLADYLSTDVVNGWTKKGRVTASKSLSAQQMKSVIKATKQFLQQETSRVAGVKSFQKSLSSKAGKKVSYKQASALYQAQKNYNWIYQYMTPSEFWDFARECVKEGWSEETFIDKIMVYITDRTLDEVLRIDLQNLYDYIQGVKV